MSHNGLIAAAGAAGLGLGYILSRLSSVSKAIPKTIPKTIPISSSVPISKRLNLNMVNVDWKDRDAVKRGFIDVFEPLTNAFVEYVSTFGLSNKFLQRLEKVWRW